MSQLYPRLLPARGAGGEQIRPINYSMLQEDQTAKMLRLQRDSVVFHQHQRHLLPPSSSSVVSSLNMEQVLQDIRGVQTLRMAPAGSSSSAGAPSLYYSHAAVGPAANVGGDSSLYGALLLNSRSTNHRQHQHRQQRVSDVEHQSVISSLLDSMAATRRAAEHDANVQQQLLLQRSLAPSSALGADWQRLLASRAPPWPPYSHPARKGSKRYFH
jgi:hypothetical protein